MRKSMARTVRRGWCWRREMERVGCTAASGCRQGGAGRGRGPRPRLGFRRTAAELHGAARGCARGGRGAAAPPAGGGGRAQLRRAGGDRAPRGGRVPDSVSDEDDGLVQAGLVGKGGGGLTALVFAAREGDIASAKALLDGGAKINQTDRKSTHLNSS